MASDDSSGPRPAGPIVLRIKLRYDDVEVMVQRFAANVGKSGLFLPTRSLQPLGTEIKFELRLADDTAVLVGLGRVKAARPPDPQQPRAAFGMAVELMRVTPQSRALILRMLERRREVGLPELGLPMASDIDAARRAEASEAGGREPATGPVAVPPPVPPPSESSPAGPPPAPSPGESLLTAPRRTGPIAVAKVQTIAPLAPEPPRRRRMALSEIIESASGPIATVSSAAPGLDDNVDVAATIARARALAGTGFDAELAALAEVAAVPVEISIDAASAELARQLGGRPVRRDRSAGWAPPPASVTHAPAPPEDEPPSPWSAPEPVAQQPELEAEPVAQQPELEAEPAAQQPELEAEPAAQQPELEPEAAAQQPELEPEPVAQQPELAPDAGLLAEVGDEHTEMGAVPEPGDGLETPAGVDVLRAAAELEAQLDEPERDPAIVDPSLEHSVVEVDDFEILAEADADDDDLLAAHGEEEVSSRRDLRARPLTGERPASELDFAARLDLGDDDSDRHVAAPAHELSADHVIDSLHDELTGQHSIAGQRTGLAGDPGMPDPHLISAGAALAALEDTDNPFDEPEEHTRVAQHGARLAFEPEPSTRFTHPGIPSDSIDPEAPPAPRGGPHDPRRPARPEPGAVRREPQILRRAPRSLHDSPVDDVELEHALEALDVDLGDLSVPHAATQLQRDPSTVPAASRSAAPQSRVPAPTPAPQSRSRAPTPAPPLRSRASTPAPPLRSRVPTAAPPRGAPAPAPAPQSRSRVPTAAPPPGAPAPTPAPQSRSRVPTAAPPPRAPAPQPRAPAAKPASQLRAHVPMPAPGARAVVPMPAPRSRASAPATAPRLGARVPAPAPQPRAASPQPRAVVPPPEQAVRHTGPAASGSHRVSAPRTPSEGVEIDFDDED